MLVLKCFYPEVTNIFSTHVSLDRASHMTSPNFKRAEKCTPPSCWEVKGKGKWVNNNNACYIHFHQKRHPSGKDSQAALCWMRVTICPLLPEGFCQDEALLVLKLGEFQVN